MMGTQSKTEVKLPIPEHDPYISVSRKIRCRMVQNRGDDTCNPYYPKAIKDVLNIRSIGMACCYALFWRNPGQRLASNFQYMIRHMH